MNYSSPIKYYSIEIGTKTLLNNRLANLRPYKMWISHLTSPLSLFTWTVYITDLKKCCPALDIKFTSSRMNKPLFSLVFC